MQLPAALKLGFILLSLLKKISTVRTSWSFGLHRRIIFYKKQCAAMLDIIVYLNVAFYLLKASSKHTIYTPDKRKKKTFVKRSLPRIHQIKIF